MPALTYTLTGGEELVARFLELPAVIGRKVARDSLRAGFAPVLAAIRATTPVRSGFLASSERLKVGRGDFPGRYSIGATASRATFARRMLSQGRRSMAAQALASGKASDRYRVFYARFVESGHGDVAANPFMKRGFDATVDKAGQTIEQVLGDGIAEQLG
jgi:HK97 gp10 family phage protein